MTKDNDLCEKSQREEPWTREDTAIYNEEHNSEWELLKL